MKTDETVLMKNLNNAYIEGCQYTVTIIITIFLPFLGFSLSEK